MSIPLNPGRPPVDQVHEPEYIYAIYEPYGPDPTPKLVSAKIIKRSPKMVFTERTDLEFHCRSRHQPEWVSFTPQDAWNRYIQTLKDKITLARNDLEKAERLLAKARVHGG